MLDLGCRAGSLQTQRGDETVGERRPVDVRIGNLVGIHVAGGSSELCRIGQLRQLTDLLLEAGNEDFDLLAHTGRSGRLAVGSGKHGDILPLQGIGAENGKDFLKPGHIFILQGFLQHDRLGGVVDVLGGQPEMHEFLPRSDFQSLEVFLDEILDCLDIVVGDFLDLLYTGGFLRGEVPVDVPQGGEKLLTGLSRSFTEVGKLWQRDAAQGDEIFDLHPHPVADKREFAEIFPERSCLGGIAAVYRRYRHQ